MGLKNETTDLLNGNFHGGGYGYYCNEYIVLNGTSFPLGASYAARDIIAMKIALDSDTLEFFKNNVKQGITITNISSHGLPLFPTAYVFNPNYSLTANFGASDFRYPIPEGFHAYGETIPQT